LCRIQFAESFEGVEPVQSYGRLFAAELLSGFRIELGNPALVRVMLGGHADTLLMFQRQLGRALTARDQQQGHSSAGADDDRTRGPDGVKMCLILRRAASAEDEQQDKQYARIRRDNGAPTMIAHVDRGTASSGDSLPTAAEMLKQAETELDRAYRALGDATDWLRSD
jgi:hypothetical protein